MILLQAFLLFYSNYLSYQYYCWWDFSWLQKERKFKTWKILNAILPRATVKYKVPQQRYKSNKVLDHLFHAFDTVSLVTCFQRPKEKGHEETRCLTANHDHQRMLLSAHKVTGQFFTAQVGLHSQYSTSETQGKALLFSSCRQWRGGRRKMTDVAQAQVPSLTFRRNSFSVTQNKPRRLEISLSQPQ